MIENHRDDKATKLMYELALFKDSKKRSHISITGHYYLFGPDVTALRQKVFSFESTCGICRKALAPGQGDLEHINGGLGPQRCDCWRTRLADGTSHTNVRRTHGMWDVENCHRKKHHRE